MATGAKGSCTGRRQGACGWWDCLEAAGKILGKEAVAGGLAGGQRRAALSLQWR
jgi:hypothetical protein